MDRSPCKVYVFKFRPSSHSEDHTIFATYKDVKTAKRAEKALRRLLEDMEEHEEDYDIDWYPENASISLHGKTVYFNVYTAGSLDDVESVIYKFAPQNVEWYRDYQELTVRAKVPKGLTPETAMLVLDREEAEAIKWFCENCGKPEVEDCGDGTQVFEWFYKGDGIYTDDDVLYLDFEFDLTKHKNWEVE